MAKALAAMTKQSRLPSLADMVVVVDVQMMPHLPATCNVYLHFATDCRNAGSVGVVRAHTMNFGEWMQVDLSTEQKFEIEKQARSLLESDDAGVFAAALLKQCCYQQQLLQQAVNEIARLECQLM